MVPNKTYTVNLDPGSAWNQRHRNIFITEADITVFAADYANPPGSLCDKIAR